MKHDNFIFKWDLKHINPQVYIAIPDNVEKYYMTEIFPFQFTTTDSKDKFRLYTVPFFFHFAFVRKSYMNKLNHYYKY